MKELLKNDLKRFFASKLTIILIIVAAFLPLFTMLVLKLPYMLEGEEDYLSELLGTDYLISSAFSFISDFGIVLPIFGCILINKDRSTGMQRNKLICGKTRTQIYLSQLISSIIYFVASILIYVVFIIVFGNILMGGFRDGLEIADLIIYILVGVLKFASLGAFITFIGLVTQKNPIGLTIAYMFGIEIIMSLLGIFFAPSVEEGAVDLFDSLLGSFNLSLGEIIRNTAIYSCIIGGTIAGGIALYNVKDIK